MARWASLLDGEAAAAPAVLGHLDADATRAVLMFCDAARLLVLARLSRGWRAAARDVGVEACRRRRRRP